MPLTERWLKFNLVGLIGIGVQLAVLALLVSGLRLNYVAATAVAVEAAVLHNFAWHERYTWRNRAASGRRERGLRLLRFHLGNGLVSLAGNVALMGLLVAALHLPYLAANAVAIGLCSLVNFALSEWLVFR